MSYWYTSKDKNGRTVVTSTSVPEFFFLICVIGLLAAIVIPKFLSMRRQSDIRAAAALIQQADSHFAQGKYADAEQLYERALRLREKALGMDHPDVAVTLEKYARLLRKTNRADEAGRMEARVKDIRNRAGVMK